MEQSLSWILPVLAELELVLAKAAAPAATTIGVPAVAVAHIRVVPTTKPATANMPRPILFQGHLLFCSMEHLLSTCLFFLLLVPLMLDLLVIPPWAFMMSN